jgi:23S rRNA (cytidine2498-2'-O)-methyltransferase
VSTWIWTSRVGFEGDLCEELGKKLAPREAGPALIATDERPKQWPCFARAGFELVAECPPAPEVVAEAIAKALIPPEGSKPASWHAQAWVPDHDQTNPLSARCDALLRETIEVLHPSVSLRRFDQASEARRYGGYLVQVVQVAADRVLIGLLRAVDAPTLAPGGRVRALLPKDAPSRAGRKLVEAFEWFGRAPEAGDVCVDLGAAPGGWTVVLLEHRAHVIAVDPAMLMPSLRKKKSVTHVKLSAFDFNPAEPVDWLCCDMAWRPIEVAQMLAKWARRRMASTLISNIKLPMKQRAATVAEVVKIVADGGWKNVRARQLYHDREEVTLSAWRT